MATYSHAVEFDATEPNWVGYFRSGLSSFA